MSRPASQRANASCRYARRAILEDTPDRDVNCGIAGCAGYYPDDFGQYLEEDYTEQEVEKSEESSDEEELMTSEHRRLRHHHHRRPQHQQHRQQFLHRRDHPNVTEIYRREQHQQEEQQRVANSMCHQPTSTRFIINNPTYTNPKEYFYEPTPSPPLVPPQPLIQLPQQHQESPLLRKSSGLPMSSNFRRHIASLQNREHFYYSPGNLGNPVEAYGRNRPSSALGYVSRQRQTGEAVARMPTPLQQQQQPQQVPQVVVPSTTIPPSSSIVQQRPLTPMTPRPLISSSLPPQARRHPVTFTTSRYYRKSSGLGSFYKRPSALCLPSSSQLDPAVCRRSKLRLNVNEDIGCGSKRFVKTMARHYLPRIDRQTSLPMTSSTAATNPSSKTQTAASGDERREDEEETCKQNVDKECRMEFDSMMKRYEHMIGDHAHSSQYVTKTETISSKGSSTRSKRSKFSMAASALKPRLPPCLTNKHQATQNNAEIVDRVGDVGQRLEVEEITTDVLDSMLDDLINSGCENKIRDEKREPSPSQLKETVVEIVNQLMSDNEAKNVDQNSQISNQHKQPTFNSFNYQDVSSNISKTTDKSAVIDSLQCKHPNLNVVQQAADHQANHASRVSVESALELHRSKSYIVNLIDRALSRELGTVVEEKKGNSSADRSADCAEKTSLNDKFEKDLCLEITNDSAYSNNNEDIKRTSGGGCCSCNLADEPPYIKQLKQLRWGHLRHIQREVKRLEDLERFLDTCANTEPFRDIEK